ncbi:hypothetical protein DU500_02880 [Haloplanus rubicundus]|uniref:Sjogrens syndrome scleroderma autoantigen 1 n=1 Tax=Haloplanus rubicundus TaxID=1547898 RepID=A0A345DZU1_9EURY|nr:Sjogren's syndrome/scleroderma autoantigen 1 family protein [Haloplanus rubicundus]AXG05463.1 hypothetical protein DU500_02880 [Haloplanus rubicundus]
MSGFDEEAERERLREKYEQDQEKRASTQRMSELLLKGATMTNSHCDTCGDPIFRHDGQEFCPTCQATDGKGAAAQEATADPDPAPTAAGTEADADATPAPEATTPDRRASPESGDDASDGQGRAPAAESDTTLSPPPSSRSAAAPLDDARASLSRTLLRYAQAAEETDDPRRAQEFLAAAREAAATLSALER